MKPTSVLTVGEVADALKCSVFTVRRRIHQGRITARREGGRFVVDSADLARYISSLERAGLRRADTNDGFVLPRGASLRNAASVYAAAKRSRKAAA